MPLRRAEAVLLAQFEAPRRVLGEPGHRAREPLSKTVIASTPSLAAEALDRLGDLRSWTKATEAGVKVRSASDTRTYSLMIDGSFDEVVLFGDVSGIFGLYFKPGLVMFPDR